MVRLTGTAPRARSELKTRNAGSAASPSRFDPSQLPADVVTLSAWTPMSPSETGTRVSTTYMPTVYEFVRVRSRRALVTACPYPSLLK
jgi:hypothetical protein